MASPYISRKEMIAAIDAGGSVSHQGQIISRKEDLPTAAQLAEGDPVQEALATSDLQRQIADLNSQLAQLQASQSTPSPATGESAGSEPQGATDGTGNSVPPVGTDGTEPGTDTAPPTASGSSGGSKK